METEDDLVRLRAVIADYEWKSRKTKWLLGRLFGKVRSFPRDLAERHRNSRNKKRERLAIDSVMAEARQSVEAAHAPHETAAPPPPQRPLFFNLHPGLIQDYLAALRADASTRTGLAEMEHYCGSEEMNAQIARAALIDPEVGTLNGYEPGFLSPWHDGEYIGFRAALTRIPPGPYDAVVLVPFGKLGGADLVAGLLATALAERGRTLILRTDLADWDRPDWYPPETPAIDISGDFAQISDRPRALYLLLRQLGVPRVYNVNSRLGFDMLVDYGARLAQQSRLYAYYFCADRDAAGNESGYPVWYFANLLPNLSAAICDTADLAATLVARYRLPPHIAARVRTVYTPARTAVADRPLADLQLASQPDRDRPRILWAGRLDRQKRFNLVVALAKAMPDVDFHAWGKAVLDAPPDLSALPPNLVLHPPFAGYDELPLREADGWLYTSQWDGLPTILIELGALGVPIVATAVGGVPELIDEATGWPVPPEEGVEGHERALRAMLADPDGRRVRSAALQARVAARHSPAAFRRAIEEVG